jgi:hypothetical protein
MTSASPALVDPRARSLVRFGMVTLLLSVTVLERFGVNLGPLSTSTALVAGYLFLALAALAGALSLSAERCLLYGVGVSVALVSLLFNETAASLPSLVLLAAMYLPFVFMLRPGSLADDDAAWVMSRFLDVAFFCAICGVAQFAAQSVVHADWLFDFTRYIPEKLRATGTFNTVIPMGSFNKSNGFFFREPSGFSYLMALGVLAEAFTRRRKSRLAALGLALLLTYSGTGLLALLLGTLHPFGPKTLLRLAVIAVVGGLVFWLLGDTLNLSFTLGRVSEFNSSYSSGYMRYVAPARLVMESVDSSWWAPWFGHGPGTIFRTVRDYEFHDPTWAKLLFEYGGAGFLAFVGLFLTMLRRPSSPLQVRAALFWGWLIMGGHLLSPEQNFLALALIGFTPALARGPRASAHEVTRQPPALAVATG